MGMFSKKKSSEEKLVDELVGSGSKKSDNLKKVLNSDFAIDELQKIVKEAWQNGYSANDIQKVYDDNLKRLENSYKEIEARSKYNGDDESLKSLLITAFLENKKTCILTIVVLVGLFIGGGVIPSFFGGVEFDHEVEVGDFNFYIPPGDYQLTDYKNTKEYVTKTYEYEYRETETDSHGTRTTTNYHDIMQIIVYKEKSTSDVLKSYKSESDKWELKNGVIYGNYTGTVVSEKGWFGLTPRWFIFTKNGKTVAIFYNLDTHTDFEKVMNRVLK